MRFAACCILTLVICEPLLSYAKKVMIVFPTQVRRSPVSPWRSNSPYFKKPSADRSAMLPYHLRSNYPGYSGKRAIYSKGLPYPQGGDDFDQDHDEVNHIHIPHGKDISYGISFGNGYIPYENIKSSFSLDGNRYSEGDYVKYGEPEYAASRYSSATTASGRIAPSSFSDSYFSQLHDRRNEAPKSYVARAIGSDSTKSLHDSYNSAVPKNKHAISADAPDFAHFQRQNPPLQSNSPHGSSFQSSPLQTNPLSSSPSQVQSSSLQLHDSGSRTHAGEDATFAATIPPATIGGSKEGVVFKDTVYLDDYNRKVELFTKNWPSMLSAAVVPGASIGQSTSFHEHDHVSDGAALVPAGVTGSNFPSVWQPGLSAQSKSGYAVKEDVMEPSHDFRTMPVQTSPFQTAFPVNVNVAIPQVTSFLHA